VRILKLCAQGGCFRRIPAGTTRCTEHQKAEDQRRNERATRHGRRSAHWRQLRIAALQRDNYQCQYVDANGEKCGRRATSVHIRPELQGDHRKATLDDCVSMCHPHHGSTDAPRAHQATGGRHRTERSLLPCAVFRRRNCVNRAFKRTRRNQRMFRGTPCCTPRFRL
jgi:hypothetical protein